MVQVNIGRDRKCGQESGTALDFAIDIPISEIFLFYEADEDYPNEFDTPPTYDYLQEKGALPSVTPFCPATGIR